MTTPINLDSKLPSDDIQNGKHIELDSSRSAVLPTKESDDAEEKKNEINNDNEEPHSGPTQVILSKIAAKKHKEI